MNEEKAIALIRKYQQGELTPQQEQQLNEWYLINATESKAELNAEQMEQAIEQLRKKLPLQDPAVKIKLWPRIVAAASVLLILGTGLWFYNSRQAGSHHPELARAGTGSHDIAPGKIGATLTLANGKKIRLSDAANGEIAKEAGISVTKTADGQLIYEVLASGTSSRQNQRGTSDPGGETNTLSTAKGETYQVKLPDGSSVWLNAASSLTYTTSLKQATKRVVELRGEGYFQVAKDKKHPFIVKTAQQEVQVLGTHFNINSYESENAVKTTLLEGSVRVSATNGRHAAANDRHPDLVSGPHTSNAITLRPNQQSILLNTGIKVIDVDVESTIAWKNGYFLFDNENIYTIMNMISRWYDVEIEYKGNMDDKIFVGRISRFKNVSEVLKLLEMTGDIHFKVQGRRITVMT
uniref:FecR family protein n=1 Tax=Pedobacter schmidteae TaxID=2201271 RepID=UPI000EAF04A2|nr:FecR family protein [Pedobacter schmidteae]